MKVKCIANLGENLSSKTLEAGHLETSEYQLTIDEMYIVYGISLWKNVLHYLTLDKYETLPFWHPADLFIVTDTLLPFEWYFKYFGNMENNYLNALWGYQELIKNENHYDALLEREDEAIRIFLKRKKEIDEMFT